MAASRKRLEHARKAGALLEKVKDSLGHGEWKPWVEANCEFSIRTAQGYMKIARRWEDLQAHFDDPAILGIEQSLRVLAKDGKPESPIKQQFTRLNRATNALTAIEEVMAEVAVPDDEVDDFRGKLQSIRSAVNRLLKSLT